jgi:exopolysaccharide production protein ExoQ
MTASWDSFDGRSRPRRIRGGEIPAPDPVAWREQRRAVTKAAAAAARRRTEQALDPRDDQPVAGLRVGRLNVDLDGVFAFALFMPMLLIANLGALGAAIVAALAPLYLFARRKQLGRVLVPRLPLFALAGVAVCSVIWSQAPGETMKTSLELAITIAMGLLLSSARDQGAVLRGMALAFLVYVAAAMVMGGTVAIGVGAGGEAFSGLTSSKNLLADIASTGLIVSVAMGLMALRARDWTWIGVAAVAVLLDLYAVVAARSAGALLGLGVALSAVLGLLLLVVAGKAVRASLTALLAIILLVVGLSYRWLSATMIELGASLFDKDPTLTGRTYLWYRAADLIRERPVLGRGYGAFWIQGNIDAEGLWRYFGIDNRGGFTFHNTLVGMLVALGWLGALVFGATLLIGAVALIRKFVVRPNLAMVFWISILLYQVSRMGIEEIGTAPFYFSTALTFGALGAAFGRVRAPRVAHRPYRQPQIVQVQSLDYGDKAWANPRLTPVRGSLRILRPDPEIGR